MNHPPRSPATPNPQTSPSTLNLNRDDWFVCHAIPLLHARPPHRPHMIGHIYYNGVDSSCGSYNCQDASHIPGHDISCTSEVSISACASKCCSQSPRCKGFDYSANDKRCCTSSVTRAQVAMERNGGPYRSCEKNSIESSPIGIVIGVSIGGLLLVGIIVTVAVVIINKNKNKVEPRHDESTPGPGGEPTPTRDTSDIPLAVPVAVHATPSTDSPQYVNPPTDSAHCVAPPTDSAHYVNPTTGTHVVAVIKQQ